MSDAPHVSAPGRSAASRWILVGSCALVWTGSGALLARDGVRPALLHLVSAVAIVGAALAMRGRGTNSTSTTPAASAPAVNLGPDIERLVETRRLESMRAFVASLTHRLANILQPLRGSAELLADPRHRDSAEHHRQQVVRHVEEAAGLTDALLAWTRQTSYTPVRTNLAHWIQTEVAAAAARMLPPGVELRIAAEDSTAEIDRVLMGGAIHCLLANAVEAMPAMPGGGVVVLGCREGVERGVAHAVLTVRDAGHGIPPELRERVWEPFFTTRAARQGDGLGLSVVQGAVERHGGRIEIDSGPEGTEIRILLPAARRVGGTTGAPRPTVLVAGLDRDLVEILEELLSHMGLRVFAATTLEDARALLFRRDAAPELVVFDGSEDLGSLLRALPTPVIVTGYDTIPRDATWPASWARVRTDGVAAAVTRSLGEPPPRAQPVLPSADA